MYRARIDSVSGTKVYADGKWLYCIGNKNHRVGDYVWTDGRCAYGHFQESQQPQVIIAPDADEGIPIYCASYYQHDLHTFQKNKLKQVDVRKRPTENTSGWSDTKLINDKRRIFIHKYLASNIDSHGNIFVMAEVYKLNNKGYYTEYKVAIFKDDKSKSELTFNKVKEIDLLAFFDENIVSKCEEPEIPFGDCFFLDSSGGTIAQSSPLGTSSSFTIRRAFIEDDNNFEILISGGFAYIAFAYGSGYSDMPIVDSGYEGYFLIKNDNVEILREIISSGERDGVTYTVTEKESDSSNPPGVYADFNSYPVYQDGKWIDLAYHTTESVTNNQVKCSVGDGFYCTMQWERYTPYIESGAMQAGGEFRYHFFSPDNTEIADIHADSRFKILFRKVKGGYLIISNVALTIYNLFGIEVGGDLIDAKFLYSPATKQLKKLDDSGCSNDRLRPLMKIKNWHKRIKEIILDLDDEKEN